ncbi:MAG: hypothetical protein BMS9Abin20_0361 [Acidimicrobiia bacterium]|nr:MAG: hypothetical protein BMS9Abin20_0361 [Acidimicrobiia bacterium]
MSARTQNVTVRYGDTVAVSDLSLEIGTGERFAIMGPSGSGKSTLLRAIAGLEPLASGSIYIDGIDVTGLPPHRRPVGLMFQDYALFPHMTVVDNVAYGLKMQGASTAVAREGASLLLERAGLTGFEHRTPTSLSGGERQRVALVRTLAREPSLVMLDEPLGSLDLALRESLLEQMRMIVSRVGATSLYVTHDRTEAFAFAQRLAIMREGSVIRVGTPDEVWNDPGTTFIARFIGHPNVVPGPSIGINAEAVTISPDAIVIDQDGAIRGSVADAVFIDGSYELAVRLPDGIVLKVRSAEPSTAGTETRLNVDVSRARELSVDKV